MDGIYFPGLGINFPKVPSGFSIFGFEIKLYGIIIAAGFMIAFLIALREAKLTGQNEENYLDYLLTLIIPAILGARFYYVIFRLDEFVNRGKSLRENLFNIINLRSGGLAVYGGIIAGIITTIVFAKKKNIHFALILDTIVMGVITGQILGRWGNFFNREVFGDFTSGVTRMAIPLHYYSDSFIRYLTTNGIVTDEMIANQEMVNGVSCITVHPAFLYEGLWNVLILVIIFIYRRKKKFDGELFTIYALCYGIGRFMIEAIRTDTLMIGPLKASQVVAVLCVVASVVILLYNYKKIKDGKEVSLHPLLSSEELTRIENSKKENKETKDKEEKNKDSSNNIDTSNKEETDKSE